MTYAYHTLVAALCIAASYVLNVHQRPRYEPVRAAEEYSEQRGSATLRQGAETRELPLMRMHVEVRDVARLDRSYKLRELSVRATGPLAEQPQLELYVDLAALALEPGDATRDPRALVQTELPLLRSGRFGVQRSVLALQGDKPRPVITGSLLFTEVTALTQDDKPVYRAAGRLELQIAGERGVELVTGRLEGEIAWDPA